MTPAGAVSMDLPVGAMFAFLLVLSRVAGLVMFLPIPGFKSAPQPIRGALAVSLTVALMPVWPKLPNILPSFPQLTAWVFCEAGFGLVAGLAVAFLIEGFQLAAQMVSMQAGYGFATSIDPTSQADSGILQVLMGLVTGLLFFTCGIDRELLRVLAASFEKFPAGSWEPTAAGLDGILHLGGAMFTVGLRVAMPVIGLLLLIDLALALLGRIQQQLQLLSLAFPVKMLAALALLTALSPVIARVFASSAERTIAALVQLIGH
jgi:flagellar biosynthetic protein FliR